MKRLPLYLSFLFLLTCAKDSTEDKSLLYVTPPSGTSNTDTVTQNATACNSFTWNGNTYNTSGNYSWSGTNSQGCDSTALLNLTIFNQYTNITNITSCDSYNWNGISYTSSGSYFDTLTSVNGCDSVLQLNLTINNSYVQTDTQTVCDFYNWNGAVLTTSGMYYDSLLTVDGCDSIMILDLTVNYSSSSSINISSCNSYAWNGNTYTQSGVYGFITTSSTGCDSSVTLNLTINYADTVTQNITILVLNEPPRMLSIDFTPDQVFRGEVVSVSIKAVDGNGVDSVSIDMFGNGGGLNVLELVEESWIGDFIIPEAFTPGERNLMIRLVDNTGESRTTSQIYLNGQFKDSNRLTILNDAPSINNITLYSE